MWARAPGASRQELGLSSGAGALRVVRASPPEAGIPTHLPGMGRACVRGRGALRWGHLAHGSHSEHPAAPAAPWDRRWNEGA